MTVDPFDIRFSLELDPDHLLSVFNRVGILAPADVHVARRLGKLGGESDPAVLLGVALAVRAPRVGHVRAELSTVRDTVLDITEDEIDLDALPWPDAGDWPDRMAASALVSVGEDGPADRPVRLLRPDALYLDRHWRDERLVAADLAERAGAAGPTVDEDLLAAGLARLFGPDAAPDQRWAAAAAVLRRFTVIAGGPGTGKTTTIARLLLLLDEQAVAAGGNPPLVALAAPTGKAAARMQEAVRAELARTQVDPATRARLGLLAGSTLHRLLVPHPGRAGRFRHDRHNHLPHDVVVVDETSMVASSLMARLLEAVRPDARLVLIGDPGQLASVEAGAVLGDVVGPAARGMRMSGSPVPAIADAIVLLRTNYRFRGDLGDLAASVRDGHEDAVMDVLRRPDGPVRWLDADVARDGSAAGAALRPVREILEDWGRRLRSSALAGQGAETLEVLGELRVLCAHRHGPTGVEAWNGRIEEWLAEDDPRRASEGQWYPGRPVMVTANDYSLRLFNGDCGAVVTGPGTRPAVVFPGEGGPLTVGPSRLTGVDTVYATTIHKAQGSEFSTVVVLLPEPTSRILTRELLYTAVTRTKDRLVLVGTEESVRSAVRRGIARASGLTALLWGAV